MILDALHQFSAAQAITAAAASTNYVDLGVANRDIGAGEDLYLAVTVDVAFTDGSSNSTLSVVIEGDSTTTFTPDATDTLGIIPALAAAGDKNYFRLHPGLASLQYRYIQVKYTPNNGDLSTGSVSTHIVRGIDANKVFPNGYTITG